MMLPLPEMSTRKRLRSLTLMSSCFWFSGGIGGSIRTKPVSTFIVVATRKKISSRKAMSAIEPALNPMDDENLPEKTEKEIELADGSKWVYPESLGRCFVTDHP